MRHAFPISSQLLVTCILAAQTIYPTTPDWTSTDSSYATGGALVDLNRDGWLDLVVANGNDMAAQRMMVYYNRGDGTLPVIPSWLSSQTAYHGHLDVADVNGDGWPDVAVAILLNQGGACAKLYMNNNGTLSSTPTWQSSFAAPAFTVAFGDMNGDGRPDLAVGTGDAYSGTPHAFQNVVHLNINGALETSPSWRSGDTWCYDSVYWVDANNDGWLDLVGGGSLTRTFIYTNLGGALELNPSWSTTDVAAQFGLMLTAGDVNKDGFRDLLVVDNNQLGGGSGRFRMYAGLPGGYFSQAATWTYYDGYVAAVALADVDFDRDLDLATGAWWDNTRIFLNNSGSLGATPAWNSAGTCVAEKIIFGDVNRDGLVQRVDTFPAGTRLAYLSVQPIQEILSVERDGVPLGPAQYTFDADSAWVSVYAPAVTQLRITYLRSTRLDMAVTTWDPELGNYLSYNRRDCDGDLNHDRVVDESDLGILLAAWQNGDAGDVDGDGDTNESDLGIVLARWQVNCR
ncbi:MAG: VCBS repeat-containing protein [Phycisphaerae bacterium]